MGNAPSVGGSGKRPAQPSPGLAHYPRLRQRAQQGGTGVKLCKLLRWGFFRELLEPPRGEALGAHYVFHVLQCQCCRVPVGCGSAGPWQVGRVSCACCRSRRIGGHRELAEFWVGKVKSRKRGDFCIEDLLFPGQRGR